VTAWRDIRQAVIPAEAGIQKSYLRTKRPARAGFFILIAQRPKPTSASKSRILDISAPTKNPPAAGFSGFPLSRE
jgi:hypothetical protein